jgi:glycosyltransferase involved in cell wall biosynthesis
MVKSSNQSKSLLIIGGTVACKDSHQIIYTKGAFALYLSELSNHYDKVLWIVPSSNQIDLSGEILAKSMKVKLYKSNLWGLLSAWFSTLLFLFNRPHTILYHSVLMLPIIFFVKCFSTKFICYLGIDYIEPIKQELLRTFPGWVWFYKKGFEYPMSKADIVLARGKYLSGIAKKFNNIVVETVPIGWPPKYLQSKEIGLTNHNSKAKILFIGKVSEEKGLKQLLLATKILIEKYGEKSLKIDIVGSGSQFKYWLSFVKSLKLSEVVLFHGWIDDPEKLENFYSTADLLVCPSVYPEGVPRVIDEAIIRGLPVVASRIGGISVEFDDNQICLFEPGDEKELADSIWSVLSNKSYRNDLLLKMKERKKRWKGFTLASEQHLFLLQK